MEGVCCLNAVDQHVDLHMAQGCTQGDGNAADSFMCVFHPCVTDWLIENRKADSAFYCKDEVSMDGEEHNVSVVTFVDDLLKTHLVHDGQACSAETVKNDTNASLDEILEESLMQQNSDKQEVTFLLRNR